MTAPDAHTDLDRAATKWIVRLTSGQAKQEDIDAARAWCELSQEHRDAFERARQLWHMASPPQSSVGPVRNPSRHSATRLALAASVLMAVAVGMFASHQDWGADYRTASAEQKRVELDDGSAVLLDADTAVDIEYSTGFRNVRLRRGRALFEVAPNASRPFTVHAGEFSAMAVGTVYSVRANEEGAEVIVSEGTVAVDKLGVKPVLVHAGEGVAADHAQIETLTSNDITAATAWQRGMLVYEQVPLAQVVAELNRYRPGYIFIANDGLLERKVSGVFQLDDVSAGLDTLSSAFDLRMTSFTPYLLILR